MQFQRTTASLFQATCNMKIEHEQEIAQLLITYEIQRESSTLPDRILLYQAREMIEQKSVVCSLDHELVELALNLYQSLGTWDEEIALLRRYMGQRDLLDITTHAWVRWHIVNCLALLEHNLAVVTEQEAFFQWATAVFPLEECFFVLGDGTQANCWQRVEKAEQWFALLDWLFAHARPTIDNHLDRFYCLRTAVHLCLRCKDEHRLQTYLKSLTCLEQEPFESEKQMWMHIEIQILHIIAASMHGNSQHMREHAQTVTHLLSQWETAIDPNTTTQREQFRSLCHNAAAPLYRAKQYDLAIPLFRKSIAHHTNPHYAYLWLAASLWYTTHERREVLLLLQQAAARYDERGNPWEHFQKLPEFQDVQEDAEFQAYASILETIHR